MKFLYKYPQCKFPYEELVEENAKRSRLEREYQILDTDAFKDSRYWDIFIETAKEGDDEEELIFRVIAYNRGPDPAPLHIVPQVWFRNTWAWGYEKEGTPKPIIKEMAVQKEVPALAMEEVGPQVSLNTFLLVHRLLNS